MKRPRLLLFSLALAAGLLALAVALRGWYAQVVAEHWRAQLQTVPDRQAEILLRQAAALGEPGIPVLVEALGSRRENVARAANRLLAQRLDSWQRSDDDQNERNQAALAEALAEQADGFGHTARRDAAALAMGILQWPPDPKVVDRSRVIACCEKVFRTIDAGGGLPTAPLQPDVLTDAPEEVGRAPLLTASSPLSTASVPREPSSSGLSLLRSLRASESADGPSPDSGPEVPRTNTLDLMRLLHADDPQTVGEARKELGRRGFGTVHFDLARRLFDPDPQVRCRLAEVLPRLHSVDPGPWLLVLCRDPAEDVRQAALTAASGLGDPQLLTQMEQIAQQGPLRRIADQATGITARRNGPVQH